MLVNSFNQRWVWGCSSRNSQYYLFFCFYFLLDSPIVGRVIATAWRQLLRARNSPPPPPWEIDNHTGDYFRYSLRTVSGFFNVPQNLYTQGLWDGAYDLSSLSEKTRKSNRLPMSLRRQHFLLSYLKTLSVGPAGTWTSGLLLGTASRSRAYPTELTGRRSSVFRWNMVVTEITL